MKSKITILVTIKKAPNCIGCLQCLPSFTTGAAQNFPEKLPTVSETEAKVFVMVISSKQFQFVRSSSRLDVMMGPLRWVITVQTTTRWKGKIGGNNSNFVSADISPRASGSSNRVNHCEKKGACVMDVVTPGGGGGRVGWWEGGGWTNLFHGVCVCVCLCVCCVFVCVV